VSILKEDCNCNLKILCDFSECLTLTITMTRLTETLLKGKRNHADVRKVMFGKFTSNHLAITRVNVVGNRVSESSNKLSAGRLLISFQ